MGLKNGTGVIRIVCILFTDGLDIPYLDSVIPKPMDLMKITLFRLSSTAALITFTGALSLSAAHHKSDPLSPANLNPHNAVVESVNYKGKQAIKAEISEEAREKLAEARRLQQATGNQGGPAAGEAGRVDHLIVVGEDFQNGTIELQLAGEPAAGASGGARGFAGVAFRV